MSKLSRADSKFWEAWRDDVLALCDTAIRLMDEQAKIRKLTEERDRLIGLLKDGQAWVTTETPIDVAKLEAERDRLREALREYGQHKKGCPYSIGGEWKCLCGFRAALEADDG